MKIESTKKILYLTWDGLTDPLGNSQILSYLKGLSNNGYEIYIVSLEKPLRYKDGQDIIKNMLVNSNIHWSHGTYRSAIKGFSTIVNLFFFVRLAHKVFKRNNIQFGHARGYIPALVLHWLKRYHGVPFIFDMRGLWPDEKVEGGRWNLRNPIYLVTYKVFKFLEQVLLRSSDRIVVLTWRAKKIIEQWGNKNNYSVEVDVIPCCADLDHFNFINYGNEWQLRQRSNYNISESTKVLCYLGSLGSWYMLDEMLDFYKAFENYYHDSTFLFITQDDFKEIIYKRALTKEINHNNIKVLSLQYIDVPKVVSIADFAISFIRPTFSKQASSPTKIGELLGLGIPVFINSGVGDLDYIFDNYKCGVKVLNFTIPEYVSAIEKGNTFLSMPASDIANVANENFSLDTGIDIYKNIYDDIINNNI